MRLNRQSLLADRLVQKIVSRIPGYHVFPAISREGLQTQFFGLQLLDGFDLVINKNVLGIQMVAVQQQA